MQVYLGATQKALCPDLQSARAWQAQVYKVLPCHQQKQRSQAPLWSEESASTAGPVSPLAGIHRPFRDISVPPPLPGEDGAGGSNTADLRLLVQE